MCVVYQIRFLCHSNTPPNIRRRNRQNIEPSRVHGVSTKKRHHQSPRDQEWIDQIGGGGGGHKRLVIGVVAGLGGSYKLDGLSSLTAGVSLWYTYESRDHCASPSSYNAIKEAIIVVPPDARLLVYRLCDVLSSIIGLLVLAMNKLVHAMHTGSPRALAAMIFFCLRMRCKSSMIFTFLDPPALGSV